MPTCYSLNFSLIQDKRVKIGFLFPFFFFIPKHTFLVTNMTIPEQGVENFQKCMNCSQR